MSPTTGPATVWYAAFGSNLLRARFTTYLVGGVAPGSPSNRVHDGARDRSLPLADAPMTIPHRLFFARESKTWGGGGMAFLDPARDPDHATLGRRWLVTAEQFADVFAQENGRDPGPIDFEALANIGQLDLVDRHYGRLVLLGVADGSPIVTFTCTDPAEVGPVRPAHVSYLAVMARGLAESWSLSRPDAARYLAERDGNHPHVDPDDLAASFDG